MAERGKVRVGNNEITRKRISAISFSIPVVIERRLRRKTRNYDEDFHHHRNEIANGKSQTFFFLLPDSLLPSWKRSRVLPSSWNHNKTEWVLDEDEEVEFIKEEGWRINLEDNLLRKFNVSIFFLLFFRIIDVEVWGWKEKNHRSSIRAPPEPPSSDSYAKN